ncbi:MAG: aminotransferase class IV [Chloroflexi bacterium]|nr:aminotransferase class IV [Chloroflexota bacterium]MCH9036243.1 aminotransferase class IV [Chloroflexota bacterium]
MKDYQDYTSYFNGEWVPYSQVMVPPHDRGFEVADVVFDQGRTFNGVPFRLEDHISRLYRSLKYMRIDSGLSPQEMTEICQEAVQRNDHRRSEVGDFNINPFVTRGPSIEGPATVCVIVKPLAFYTFARFYIDGAHGVIVKTRSYSSDIMDPKVKHHSRANFVLAELEARDIDPDGLPIMLDMGGNITEGIGYNVFLVKDGVLKTPTDRNVLQGVSRKVIIEIAGNLGIPVSEEDLQPYDIYTADEVFFSRTSPRIVPLSKVDTRPIGGQFPGPITQHLLAAHSEMVGVDIVDQALHYAGIEA